MNMFFLECTQLEDPRLEWRAIQEAMLRDYLHTAQDVLEVSTSVSFSCDYTIRDNLKSHLGPRARMVKRETERNTVFLLSHTLSAHVLQMRKVEFILSVPAFTWRERLENYSGIMTLGTPDLDSNPDLPVIERPVSRCQCRGVGRPSLRLLTPSQMSKAKKEIYDVKQQRLCLAQEEYNHLHTALATLNTSRTSLCSSSSSVSTKYDPDLLKADVALAKNRVGRLKSELEQIRTEMHCTQRGVDTLAS
uniref:(California timema) hypothetical protein n=1 Tax=Timema californicum TaxID=61474 RepID=A0A7R9PF76_TIMCA|nr:unnamed protein product [Timema californicum]